MLVSEQTEVSPGNPYSREKLCPILAFFVEDTWEKCCEKSIAILQNEGAGHTLTIHSTNEEIIRQFALKKPVSRLLVNTSGAGRYGVSDGQKLKVEIGTQRPVTFDDVVIRVRDDYTLAMHIDLDEANTCAFQTGESGRLVR